MCTAHVRIPCAFCSRSWNMTSLKKRPLYPNLIPAAISRLASLSQRRRSWPHRSNNPCTPCCKRTTRRHRAADSHLRGVPLRLTCRRHDLASTGMERIIHDVEMGFLQVLLPDRFFISVEKQPLLGFGVVTFLHVRADGRVDADHCGRPRPALARRTSHLLVAEERPAFALALVNVSTAKTWAHPCDAFLPHARTDVHVDGDENVSFASKRRH